MKWPWVTRRHDPAKSDGTAELEQAKAAHRETIAVAAAARERLDQNHLTEAIIAQIQGGKA